MRNKEKNGPVAVRIINFSDTGYVSKEASFEECESLRAKGGITWIDVDGIRDEALMGKISSCYALHPLVVEDIQNTGQRPKIEDYGDYVYIVLKMLYPSSESGKVVEEQVSIIFSRDLVVSFQEEGKKGDVFGDVRERLASGNSRLRKSGADQLVYSMIDAVVDGYFALMEDAGEKIEALEARLVSRPDQKLLHSIQAQKKELLLMRRSVWPLRDVLSSILRGEYPLFSESSRTYLRDVYDHTIQVVETLETFRDLLSSVLDIYLSSVSNRLNEVMKVLTMISTLFIPLTFIVGIYGMNFRFMPELDWKYGYLMVWAVMAAVAAGMFVFFKKKKWL